MKKLLSAFSVILFLSGCALLEPVEQVSTASDLPQNYQPVLENQNNRDGEYLYYYIANSYSNSGKSAFLPGETSQVEGYGKLYSFNGEKSLILSEVVSKMADQLLVNFPTRYRGEAIALTSLVDLNDHKKTNWIGQTVTELFIHELHIRQLQVVDYKLTGDIQITSRGEFALTRDWKRLNKNIDVRRIFTGTMSRNEEGLILNVRIVNTDTSIVESTSSAFIPHGMFVGGEYDYRTNQYYNRNSQQIRNNRAQVHLVK
ncbi:hypothetical protein PCNPT3_03085 [Psychromonas sp. CNPT3]|uniref:FlgO family outer membrane protein n=1 Tax=Psychromonas sp. CNPT3 TaxID=314282 RepID=UPI00006E9919|nr:FlgO family outer membrane protein [Psychromonas sp. CNPT3]AGH80559.1 hypothetical protein PCNPT3_03085 [Psychromonas sp. CNPT3]